MERNKMTMKIETRTKIVHFMHLSKTISDCPNDSFRLYVFESLCVGVFMCEFYFFFADDAENWTYILISLQIHSLCSVGAFSSFELFTR